MTSGVHFLKRNLQRATLLETGEEGKIMRFHVLKAAGLLGLLLPVVSAEATIVTSPFAASYYITTAGVSVNSPVGKTVNVGGNATNSGTGAATLLPAFTVFQENGATLLNSLRTASGVAGGTVSSITSLNLNLYDQYIYGGITPAAGSLVFSYAAYSTTPLNEQTSYSSPVYDTTQVGGVSSQFGSTDSLGTATYALATSPNALETYSLTGAAGLSDIQNAIDSGSMFYIIASAGTSTTAVAFGGYTGTPPFETPANLAINATVSAVPEPASLGILATSGLFLLGRRRRTASV